MNTTTTPKFCKDCRWCAYNGEMSTCCSPQLANEYDLVTGGTKAVYSMCSVLRQKSTIEGLCGPDAAFFQAKEGA